VEICHDFLDGFGNEWRSLGSEEVVDSDHEEHRSGFEVGDFAQPFQNTPEFLEERKRLAGDQLALIKFWLERSQALVTPKSTLGKAIAYANGQAKRAGTLRLPVPTFQ